MTTSGSIETPAPRAPKQEQMDASPEIVEVRPVILRLQLPIDFTGLGHVNTYALEDDRGFTLIDPGLPGRGVVEGAPGPHGPTIRRDASTPSW